MKERRADARFGQPLIDGFHLTARPGIALATVNLSAGGALVHAGRPLRPGARIHVQFATALRSFWVIAEVLRCGIAGLDADHGVTYRAALRFEKRCELPWEHRTRSGYSLPVPAGEDVLSSGHQLPVLLPETGPTDQEC
jgi:PilZ domain-containing protein